MESLEQFIRIFGLIIFFPFQQIQIKAGIIIILCLCSSKLRQLFIEIHSKTMNEQHSFVIHELVWAKVEHYPWWPAKIANRLRQNSKTVYKLKFFGDSSSCYLHSENIVKFQRFDTDQQIHKCKDLKLKKSIQLAKVFFSKQSLKYSQVISEDLNTKQQNPQTPITHQETQIESKDYSCLLQKMIMEQPVNTCQSPINDFFQKNITPDNVLQMLEGYTTVKKNTLRGSLNRKQLISFESNLKQNLLLKYNLNFHLQNQFKIDQKNNTLIDGEKKSHFRKIKLIRKLKNKYEPIQSSIRKLQQLLSLKMQSNISKRLSYQIIKKLEVQSRQNKNVFCKIFFKTIQKINNLKIIPTNIEEILIQQQKQIESKNNHQQTSSSQGQTSCKDSLINP